MTKVCLDAGHGGKDGGACALGRKEKDDVLRLVLRVGQILSANGIEIFYNRTTDVFENVNTKARKANAAKVDFFASFHRNAANGVARGNETLVYNNVGKAKICSDRANQKMQECGFTQRGTKIVTNLAVLNSTKMPAVLFETGFIDNAVDNHIFDSQFEKIAQGYAEAITIGVLGREVFPEKSGWVQENGANYYYENGKRVVGEKYISGHWYYFDNAGALYQGWKKLNSKTVYYAPDGKMVFGQNDIEGKTYYFGKQDGALVVGEMFVDGAWRLGDEKGEMICGWHDFPDKRVYYREDGVMMVGLCTISGKNYFFSPEDGHLMHTKDDGQLI